MILPVRDWVEFVRAHEQCLAEKKLWDFESDRVVLTCEDCGETAFIRLPWSCGEDCVDIHACAITGHCIVKLSDRMGDEHDG